MGAALTAFAVVFVAELGDRTQLLLLALATRHAMAPVLAGTVLGYGLTTAVAVALGAAVGAALPETAVQVGSGIAFLGFAVWTLLAGDDEDDDEVDEPGARHPLALVASLTGAIIASEIGDKSMLAAATLATEADPLPVWLGATAGILTSGVLAIIAGRLLGERVDPTVLRWASAALFAAFGVAMLLQAL